MGWKWVWRPPGGGAEAFDRTVDRAHAAAVQEVVQAAQRLAPRRTGEYAGSIRGTVSGKRAAIGSHLPQAGAVERGANVGPRRGPHMAGQPSIRPAALTEYQRGFERAFRTEGVR